MSSHAPRLLEKNARAVKHIKKIPLYTALITAVIAVILFSILFIQSILRVPSSTSAIGFIYLPVWDAIVFATAALSGYALGILIRGFMIARYRKKISFFMAVLIILPLSLYLTSLCLDVYITSYKINRISVMNTTALEEAYRKTPAHTLHGYTIYLFAAIAQNPQASSALLDKMAHRADPRFNDRLLPLIDLNKKNDRGHSVMRLIVANPNVSVNTLVYLADTSSDDYVIGDIARMRQTPITVLRTLYQKYKNSMRFNIAWDLASNPNTPADILCALTNKSASFQETFNAILNNNPSYVKYCKKRNYSD